MKLTTASLALFALCSLSVNAWGPLGHSTVAAVALRYLRPEALEQTRTILSYGATEEQTLVTVANWADSYRKTKEGKYSYFYHFIDVNDEPLKGNCNVNMTRDCSKEKGCIVTAIANYTSRATDATLGTAQTAEALRFLTHLFGDIHQPLHNEGAEEGGNRIPVLFDGKPSNLHRAWDNDKIQDFFGNYTIEKAQMWAQRISREINRDGGIYHEKPEKWAFCQNLNHPTACALEWSTETNRLNCEFVYAKDPTNEELNDGFYPDWIFVIEKQVARGGVRLAAWLNLIFTGSTGFDASSALTVMDDVRMVDNYA
ncbi:hypothetical protein FRB94_008514 [Tulasnella sp. JGI-2019a]|nr:hypothetical protein FRB94_008514 [Tulasnella sp. JGI-2019a]KAG9027178.1 hypothetical protein FRB95_008014 [Tulasnella sp. JGI-2019a]